jgi:16S rRNA (cytidine1402-2'-O)-methyltransferase
MGVAEGAAEAAASAAGGAPSKPMAPGLYLVATPIGNLDDITLRALNVLRSVDRIACEDTRQTSKLLSHFGIPTPMVSYHAHNELSRASELIEALKAGARIAVVSDAGTPGIADPGAALVAEAIAADVVVFPIPGANAALSALVASGLSAENFSFHGFLPAKEGQRRSVLEALRAAIEQAGGGPASTASTTASTTHIFYEAPHRILATIEDVVTIFGPGQRLVLAREITKLHEEFLRGGAGKVLAALGSRPVVRGEMVLLVEGALTPERGGGSAGKGPAGGLAEEIAGWMRTGMLSESDAVKRVAKARGMGKSEVYREWQRSRQRSDLRSG